MNFYNNICNRIFSEHSDAENYKSGIGKKGLYEQAKQNRRFYSGDQWYGAKTGADKPLVRNNIIKRIGDYKTAIIGGNNIDIDFSAVGIAHSQADDKLKTLQAEITEGKKLGKITDAEIALAAKSVAQYFKYSAKRLHLEDVCNRALKNAYITGSGIVYAYWDCNIKTGLFADDKRQVPIMGDVCAEVIDIENVDFADPTLEDVQQQEYIIISSRCGVGQLRREAKSNGINQKEIEKILPDNEYCDSEALYSQKATVLTKFYKVFDDQGDYTIKAIRVCKNTVIKPEWDIGLKRYPIAKFNWEKEDAAYGESEITNLIPNQIAINRMLTASVWSVMMMGMPIMLVNGDVIDTPITNTPGQIVSFSGNSEDFDRTIKYVAPQQFSNDFDSITTKLIENTLNAAGATDAALGTIKAQNTSAINAVKETARLPLSAMRNRFVSFVEDISLIFLEFMLNMYGSRPLVQKSKDCTWYFPFDAQRYKNIRFICEGNVATREVNGLEQLIDEIDNLNKAEKKVVESAIEGKEVIV